MSIFKINKYLTRPLKFFELQYAENYINNPHERNKDYFHIISHLDSKLVDLNISDIERLTRLIILGETEETNLFPDNVLQQQNQQMDIDEESTKQQLSLKNNAVRNIPKVPVYINGNLSRLQQENNMTPAQLQGFLQLDQEVILRLLQQQQQQSHMYMINETIQNLQLS